MTSIGEILIEYCHHTLYGHIKNLCSFTKKLNGRKYTVYKLTSKIRSMFIKDLYMRLKAINVNHYGINEILLSPNSKSVHLYMNDSKPLWYRIGLALSDGSILYPHNIIFTTSTSHTIDAILKGFSNAKIYLARYMVSKETGKRICAYNIVTYDPEVVDNIHKMKRENNWDKTITILKSNREYLAQFLAGVIDGDGTIDKDNIRISTSANDPIYRIISEIFYVKYDHKRYMLRIGTKLLRDLGIISNILQHMVAYHKRDKLRKLSEKRYRFELKITSYTHEQLMRTIKCLNENELHILSMFKYRIHGKYTYTYISAGSKNINTVYRNVLAVFSKIGSIFNVDLSKAVKIGAREIIIYNQDVVNMVKQLQKMIREGR